MQATDGLTELFAIYLSSIFKSTCACKSKGGGRKSYACICEKDGVVKKGRRKVVFYIKNSWLKEKTHECLFLAAGRTCSSQQFTCSNGQCIPSAYRCDRVKDCTDGTDERDCRES